jgi:hypothetical protein
MIINFSFFPSLFNLFNVRLFVTIFELSSKPSQRHYITHRLELLHSSLAASVMLSDSWTGEIICYAILCYSILPFRVLSYI